MTINGVELEYDFFDLEKMKQHDQALAELQKANEKIMESEGDPYQKMTAQMECIERFFDILFGHGSGTAICGGNNVREHLTAFRELEEEKNRQMEECRQMARAIAEAEVQHVRKPAPAAAELSIPAPGLNRSYEDIVAGIAERAKDESAR
ncbi:hypothetical protein NIA70_05335 [[Clostridium] scindens]|uniref:DUF6673 family protein n=1 Tax=Clostridium scindens (strain JCM 10418 / VPI 12708) TaxID=29347 RepID=UPI00205614E9|nr:DUF6673 family protein [[Clostridium] scindens]MCO7171578.1 hypothetical protein [[Clostridium] scindens]DAL41780.1 MAG TPA_asm: hypothetical protein [Caudoviricetes sp.]